MATKSQQIEEVEIVETQDVETQEVDVEIVETQEVDVESVLGGESPQEHNDNLEQLSLEEATQKSEDISNRFKEFTKGIDEKSQLITTKIDVKELDEIGEDIVKAREILLSYTNGEKSSARVKMLKSLKGISFMNIGKKAESMADNIEIEEVKSSGIEDVINGMYDSFELKKDRLIDLVGIVEQMKKQLKTEQSGLRDYIIEINKLLAVSGNSVATKLKCISMSNMAKDKYFILDGQINTKLATIEPLILKLVSVIDETMPSLKSQLTTETRIGGVIASIKDSLEMMSTMQELSQKIVTTSTDKVYDLITESYEVMGNQGNIEHLKKMGEINEKFSKRIMLEEEKSITKSVNTFKTLNQLQSNSENLLTERMESQKKVLRLSFDNMNISDTTDISNTK